MSNATIKRIAAHLATMPVQQLDGAASAAARHVIGQITDQKRA